MERLYRNLTGTNKFTGINVIPFTIDNMIHNTDYAVTIKLDGVRSLLFSKNKETYMISKKMEFIKFSIDTLLPNDSIYDGELFNGKFYIFDVLFHEGKDVRILNLQERIKYYQGIDSKQVIPKLHYISRNLYNTAKTLLKTNYLPIDGLIFTPINTGYSSRTPPLKWKYNVTIDFKIRVKSIADSYHIWDLLCMNNVPFHPKKSIRVPSKIASEYNDKSVVEFEWKNNTFNPIRSRTDKTDGNYIKVALNNYNLILHPVRLSVLKDIRGNSYFYELRRFHNWIKTILLELYVKRDTDLLDLASGKGGDLHKWKKIGVKRVVGIDIDRNSIKTAIIRRENVYGPKSNIMFYKRNLSIDSYRSQKLFETVTCFFAIHYFFKNTKSLDNILKNVSNNLKTGGYFIGTAFDSNPIMKDLSKGNTKGPYWEITPGKMNKTQFLGNEINVELKSTVLNEKTTEYLINIPFFIREALKYDLKIVKIIKFKQLHVVYNKVNKEKLNNSQKHFSYYNFAFVFKKV